MTRQAILICSLLAPLISLGVLLLFGMRSERVGQSLSLGTLVGMFVVVAIFASPLAAIGVWVGVRQLTR